MYTYVRRWTSRPLLHTNTTGTEKFKSIVQTNLLIMPNSIYFLGEAVIIKFPHQELFYLVQLIYYNYYYYSVSYLQTIQLIMYGSLSMYVVFTLKGKQVIKLLFC